MDCLKVVDAMILGSTVFALGCDVSHWQGEIDFAKMYAAGARFVFLKASQAAWTDRRFVQNYNAARQTPLLVGMYHYLDWTKPAIEQARYFASLVKEYPPDLPPVLDYECRTNTPMREKAAGEAKAFVMEVQRYTSIQVMLYTSRGYWNEYGSDDRFWVDVPLWFAYYTNLPVVITDLIPPRPFRAIEFWHFTERGDGALYGVQSKQIDLNYYNGTEQDLLNRYGKPVEQPDPSPVSAVRLRVVAPVLNVRQSPTTTTARIGQLAQGAVIVVEAIHVESPFRVWVKHSTGWSAVVYDGSILMREVR